MSEMQEYLRRFAQDIAEHPSLDWTLLGGCPCATAHFFFKDGGDRPCALLLGDRDKLEWGFLDLEDARYREERLGRATVQNNSPEKEFELALVEQIKATGRSVRRQVRTKSGRVDIVIDDPPLTLIEVKAIGDISSVAQAAAQLWGYAPHFPGARLAVAAPPPVEPTAITFFNRLGMSLWN